MNQSFRIVYTNCFKGIIFFLLSINNINAAGPDLFHLADSLRSIGQYDYAAIEYERAYFNSEDVVDQANALLNKAGCYKSIEKFELAEKSLSRINYFGLDDSMVFRARYQTALCAYLAGHFSAAESQLLQLNAQVKDSTLAIQSLPVFALVLNELHRWPEAKSQIIYFIERMGFPKNFRDSLNNIFEVLYRPENIPRLKKQNTAKILSSVIPGSGQVYSGFFWEGIGNASLQGTALLLTAYGIYSGYYITSVVVWFGLFQKFYSGAIVRTEYLVEKKNYELTKSYNEKLKKEIVFIQGIGIK